MKGLVIPLVLVCSLTLAQRQPGYLGFDAGFATIFSSYKHPDFIRDTNDPSVTFDPAANGIRTIMTRSFAGVRIESPMAKGKFLISGGVRYTQLDGYVDRRAEQGYVYLRLYEDGTSTEYLRVTGLHQKSGYLSVPLEFRMFPFKEHRRVSWLMIGSDVNYKLYSDNDVRFQDSDMNKYGDQAASAMGSPKSWYGSFYAGLGWRFGKPDKTLFNFGFTMPIFLTNSVSTLMRPVVGVGITIQIQFNVRRQQ